MGASVSAYWPGITQKQLDSQPGFFNDCKAWGDWMAEREQHPEVLEAINKLEIKALSSFKTNGVADTDVNWVTPAELAKAVLRLCDLVRAHHPDTRCILDTYEKSANGVDSIEQEFIQDLEDIAGLARYAEQQGVRRMTLEVNW